MSLVNTKVSYKAIKKHSSSLFVRILEIMIEGQTISAENIKNTHLKSLSDDALEDLGYSKLQISRIRRTPSSGRIL